MATQKIRKPGAGRRPQTETDAVRRRLLDTARRLFAGSGYQAVTVRTLAREAQVTPAMIHYYFGNKQGLYLAVLKEALAPSLKTLTELVSQGRHDPQALQELLQTHMTLLSREDWIAPLVTREILLRDGPLQDAFADQIVSRIRSGLLQLTADTDIAERSGENFAVLSVMALTLFPFIARAMLAKVYALPVDEAFAATWSRHIAKLIHEPLEPRPAPLNETPS